MGQLEVQQFLEGHGPASISEIAEGTGMRDCRVSEVLKRMAKWNDVRLERKRLNGEGQKRIFATLLI